MVDLAERKLASDLMAAFRDGLLDNEELQSQWPRHSDDEALRKIYNELWFMYSDTHVHKMVGKYAPSDEQFALLNRMQLFLKTTHEYEWGRSRIVPVFRIPLLLKVLSLGVLWPVDFLLGEYNSYNSRKLFTIGDVHFWPFISREQFNGAQAEL